jgi:hypothetical protein
MEFLLLGPLLAALGLAALFGGPGNGGDGDGQPLRGT